MASLLYPLTIFLSAFLLFQVQPLLGRYVLPWFGGTPGVWTVTLLFFQIALFFGYVYSHLIAKRLSVKKQVGLHLVLIALALLWLPVTPSESLKPIGSELPSLQLMFLLASSVSIPYIVLASTSPLLQSWFSKEFPQQNPYRLYALSNIGSLGALFTYPLLVEPFFSSKTQTIIWSGGFLLFALLCTITGVRCYLNNNGHETPLLATRRQVLPVEAQLGWLFKSFTAVVVLLAITNYVSVDLAVHPLLWVVPLGLYLLSFILTFESDRWYNPRVYAVAFLLILVVQLVVTTGLIVGSLLQYCLLFICCMLCHGSLAATRPQNDDLTSFYLTTAGGGALGGLFVAILAPLMFSTYAELPIGWLLTTIIVAEQVLTNFTVTWQRLVPLVTICSLAIGYACFTLSTLGGTYRNFFGVLRVGDATTEDNQSIRTMLHGQTIHGLQFVDQSKSFIATSYFGKQSAAGAVLSTFKIGAPRSIGVVGLGIGTVASYGLPGDTLRYYEINPEVVRLAKQEFSYIKQCKAHQEFVLGDARIALERETSNNFDILMLDAFSGGTPPIHLLTSEAFTTYLRHLKADGVLIANISNRFFDFAPVLYGLAAKHQLAIETVISDGNPKDATTPAYYAVLARSQETLKSALPMDGEVPPSQEQYVFWTDMRHDLLRLVL
jgi:spermidine synthase